MKTLGMNARRAARALQAVSNELKNETLMAIAERLVKNQKDILEANARDIENAYHNNLVPALIERLTLNEGRIYALTQGIYDIVRFDDPVGRVLEHRIFENGLDLKKVAVPLGVVAIIYESRPNVTVDAFALCFKSGNAIILKGGKEAIETNHALERVLREVLFEKGLDPNCVQLIKDTTRAATVELMHLNAYVDVLIPRGSGSLIQTVLKESTIPVIQTGEGNCHIYVDASADLDQAFHIFKNAKTQRVGVCNACESLVLDKAIARPFLKRLVRDLPEVELVGDVHAVAVDSRILPATLEDFYTEYLDLKCSVKVVESLEEAIEHINVHTTHHSDAIITEDADHMETFLNAIDAAVVYVNASTRFTDGYEFGLGAEMGISTQKLHVRGPVGLDSLVSYKYKVKGKGQIR